MSINSGHFESRLKGKIVNIRVSFLNDTVHAFQMPVKALGVVLWEAVTRHLELLEADYFGLQYTNRHGDEIWMDNSKLIVRQLPSPDSPVRFGVKFYTPDPGLLEDDLTRFLLAQQVRKDLWLGEMRCTGNTAAVIAAYVVQGELGDFLINDHVNNSYLSSFNFLPKEQQTAEFLDKVIHYHQQYIGESPSEADGNLLDVARKVELYSVKFHSAKDHDGILLNLAVDYTGVLVFQGLTKINTFSWAKIRKLSFKRTKFLVKLHPDSYGYYKDTVEFFFAFRDRCKYFWKRCIEHHTFFRCQSNGKPARHKAMVVSRGSSFRYSGRTQRELQNFIRRNRLTRPNIERSMSSRISYCSVTPTVSLKPSMLNTSNLHNSTESSGSQVLAHSTSGLMDCLQAHHGTADGHSESSMSGSHSIGSPRLECPCVHGNPDVTDTLMQPSESTAVEGHLPDDVDSHAAGDTSHSYKCCDSSPSLPAISASPSAGRLSSSPVFPSIQCQALVSEHQHSQADEVENMADNVPVENGIVSSTLRMMPPLFDHEANGNTDGYEDVDFDRLPTPPPSPPCEHSAETTCVHLQVGVRAANGELAVNTGCVRGVECSPLADIYQGRVSVADNNSSTCYDSAAAEVGKELKRIQCRPTDTPYFVAKELLMTERTYRRDLTVLCVWFRNAMSVHSTAIGWLDKLVFPRYDPIFQLHCRLLKQLEKLVINWEWKSSSPLSAAEDNEECCGIGGVLLDNLDTIHHLYRSCLSESCDMLLELDQHVKGSRSFEDAYMAFEAEKVCYLPLTAFFLKPGQRLFHYGRLLESLNSHYPACHPDAASCKAALAKVTDLTDTLRGHLEQLRNIQRLVELQRDLEGLDDVCSGQRELIREGCVLEYTSHDYQQRMVFLFSDMLVLTCHSATPPHKFKVQGRLALTDMVVEEIRKSNLSAPNSFAVYGTSQCILMMASSQEEKDKWMEDITSAIESLVDPPSAVCSTPHVAGLSPSCCVTENDTNGLPVPGHVTDILERHWSNAMVHACWHRNTSVSNDDHMAMFKNQMSGYLLRRFKTRNSWQKLWVVLTDFCLFFHKSSQSDWPLASLPLLGYAVSEPCAEDNIGKEHVIKLQFRKHIYFFRAESQYAYMRWLEVITTATSSARLTRLFSRMTSDRGS